MEFRELGLVEWKFPLLLKPIFVMSLNISSFWVICENLLFLPYFVNNNHNFYRANSPLKTFYVIPNRMSYRMYFMELYGYLTHFFHLLTRLEETNTSHMTHFLTLD